MLILIRQRKSLILDLCLLNHHFPKFSVTKNDLEMLVKHRILGPTLKDCEGVELE